MKGFKRIAQFVALSLFLAPITALAVPTFQVYIEGSTAVNYSNDQDTWLYDGAIPFTLDVVGAFGPNTVTLTDLMLVVSVPNGETGVITIGGLAAPSFYSGMSWIPPGANFNNHYPLQDNISDFYLFDLGDFYNVGTVNNYNADAPGGIELNAGVGEQRQYVVTGLSGFTSSIPLHFDVFGLVTDSNGTSNYRASWEISPGSHDSTARVPEPGTLLLLGSGLLGLGLLQRVKRRA